MFQRTEEDIEKVTKLASHHIIVCLVAPDYEALAAEKIGESPEGDPFKQYREQSEKIA